MPKLCKQCGCVLRRSGHAMYCFQCYVQRTRVRIAQPGRVRNADMQPLLVEGRWHCVDCGEGPIHPIQPVGKKTRPRLRCETCHAVHRLQLDFLSGRNGAQYAMYLARKSGLIPPPTDFQCKDCERPAECYDHRDYGRPLDVDAVCRSCNVMRGHAKPLNPFLVSAMVLMHLAGELPIPAPLLLPPSSARASRAQVQRPARAFFTSEAAHG